MQEILTDPNIIFLLLTLGIFAVIYEFALPGGFIAGMTGTVLLALGGYALTIVPFSIMGLVLITIGLIVMASEAFIRSKGLLAFIGALVFAVGSFLLFNDNAPQRLSWITIISTTAFVAGGLTFLLGYVVKIYRRRPALDFSLQGQKALVVDWGADLQRVEVEGAYWQARSLSGKSYRHGDWVTIQRQENLTLLVE